jgi:hypothetical protein
MAALRTRTAHCTVGAQFEDSDGLACEGALAKRFSTAGGEAVTLMNPRDAAAKVRVRIDGLRHPARASRLYDLDGTAREAPVAGESAVIELELAPRAVAVWELA